MRGCSSRRFCVWRCLFSTRVVVSLFFLLGVTSQLFAQDRSKSLLERLGYSPETKLLIVHADDVGMTHSVNAATFAALDSGAANSASIMVPCPWFLEVADYAKAHPNADFGLHLTLTSERVYYRWGPVASKNKVPSLLDENGYFHLDWTPAVHINPREAELELRAQIALALAAGVHPTHLDSHQYRLPFFLARDWFADHPYLETSLGSTDMVLDHTVTISPGVPPAKWADFYVHAFKDLQPGVTEFVIHLAYANDEMIAATRERDTWGAAWRQRDFDFFSSPQFRELLKQQNIKLITWRELSRASR